MFFKNNHAWDLKAEEAWEFEDHSIIHTFYSQMIWYDEVFLIFFLASSDDFYNEIVAGIFNWYKWSHKKVYF